MKLSTNDIAICGMFAALIVVGAFIKIDIPLPFYTMHFTFQWFFVLMASFLLGAKLGTLSVISYIILGLAGLPVFAAGGGPQYVLRPGFGFLLGFVFAAFAMGAMVDNFGSFTMKTAIPVSVIGLIIYYAVGAVYFYLIKNFYAGDYIPFNVIVVQYCLITVFPDFILCAMAVLLSCKLKVHVSKMLSPARQII